MNYRLKKLKLDFKIFIRTYKKESFPSTIHLLVNCITSTYVGSFITFIVTFSFLHIFFENIITHWVVEPILTHSPNSIIYTSKYFLYFTYNILQGQISNIDFSHALSLDQTQFNEKISFWVKNDYETDLRNKLEEVEISNKDIFEKVVKGILFLVAQKRVSIKTDSIEYAKFNEGYFLKLMGNKNGQISKLYNDNSEYKFEIINIFKNAIQPHLFAAPILNVMANGEGNYGLNQEECFNILLAYFKNYCSIEKILNKHHWNLLRQCAIVSQIDGDNIERKLHSEAIKIFQDFIVDNYNKFITFIIQPDLWDNNLFKLSDWVDYIFLTKENFLEHLDSIDEIQGEYVSEFKNFVNDLEENNWELIPFDFDEIPLEEIVDKFNQG